MEQSADVRGGRSQMVRPSASAGAVGVDASPADASVWVGADSSADGPRPFEWRPPRSGQTGDVGSGGMATFGLVHGVCAGGWCWEGVTPLLEAAGHDVVAVDLPCEDRDATFSDYAEVVHEALGARDDVVLVGHSTGGLTIPLVAVGRPVRELVFLCGVIPVPGQSVVDQGFDFRGVD